MMMYGFRFAAFAVLSALTATPLWAQDAYPARPIHMIVPFPAGGPSDVMARLIGDKMSADFGQAVVIETFVQPDGFVAAAHVHPSQEERFEILRGSVGFRIGR